MGDTLRAHPGGWVLLVLAGTALALTAAGAGWIVCVVLVAAFLAVPLAQAATAARRYLKVPRAVTVTIIPVGLVSLILLSLTLGGIQIGSAIVADVERGQAAPVPATRAGEEPVSTAAQAITHLVYRPWMERLAPRERMGRTVDEWLKSAHRFVGSILSQVMTGLNGVLTGLGVLLVSAIVAGSPGVYYRVFVGLFPEAQRRDLEPILGEIGRRLGRWALARACSATALALMTMVGLWIAGTPWAFGLGLITGLLSFVPIIGTLAAGVLAALTVILSRQGSLLGTLVVFVLANVVETYVILPLLLRRAANIPAGLTLGFLLVMGTIGGLAGMLIASPLALVITTVSDLNNSSTKEHENKRKHEKQEK